MWKFLSRKRLLLQAMKILRGRCKEGQGNPPYEHICICGMAESSAASAAGGIICRLQPICITICMQSVQKLRG